MPSEREKGRLEDIRDHIRVAFTIVGALTEAEFEGDRVKVLAATRCLEIVSEATRSLSDALKARHPQISWRRIANAGNFYRHDYRGVSERIIYATIRNELNPLLAAVEAELAEPDHSSRP